MDNTFRERFRNASPQELVDALNSQVGNSGWVTARGFYLAALRDAFLATGLDCSDFIKGGGITLIQVRLDGDRVVSVTEAPKPTVKSTDSASAVGAAALQDPQWLIDALIRSMEWGNEARGREFGAQLISQCGDLVEDGILRPFDELHDLELMLRLLDPSPGRVLELEEGATLTHQEAMLLAEGVAAECFQSDGANDAWAIVKIQSSAGIDAFLAETISGCSWEGIEREFVGAFPSIGKAREALQKLGYLDGDDFRLRYPS